MGSGKTSAMIQTINSNPDETYIYIVPYLDEVERIKECTRLIEPVPYHETKLENFHRLLNRGVDIVSTHALFLSATEDTIQLIHDNGYTLILDEALDVFQNYNDMIKSCKGKAVNKDTVKWLIDENHITVSDNHLVTWNSTTPSDFQFSEVARMAHDKVLFCIDNTLFWIFNPKIFTAFENVFILTYQHEGTLFDSYLKMHHISYDIKSIRQAGAGAYRIANYVDDTKRRREIASLIRIYEGDFNRIGNRRNSLSINNLMSKNREEIEAIRSCMQNYKRNLDVRNTKIMWTTSKQNDFYLKFNKKPLQYTKKLTKEEANNPPKQVLCFVSCNAKGTNDFSNRTTLMYILNRYLNPEIQKYFSSVGYPLDEDRFALNELIQWVFRSAIRNGEKINIYIPSKRMRTLLYDWLGVYPHTTRTLEKRRG